MTSKLKTDVLETGSGSGTIALNNQLSGMTAESMPSGSVLKTHYLKSPDQNQVTIAAGVTTVIDTLSVTTVGASSRLVIFFDTQQFVKGGANSNPNFLFSIDGTDIPTNTEFGHHHWHIGYGSNAAREDHMGWYVSQTLSAGSHTIVQSTLAYNDTITVKHQGRYQRYMIQEIKE